MLHLRRTRGRRVTKAVGGALLSVWDRMVAADPGMLRLLMAARGTAAVALTSLTTVLAARAMGAPPLTAAQGITFSLMAAFLMREATRRQRERTMVLLAGPAVAAAAATTLLHGDTLVGDALFLVLVFACFLLQGRGPRAIGIGLMAVICCYVGLFLELPLATLPAQLASIAVAMPVTWFACFVLLPMRPGAQLRRTIQAVQGRAAAVLDAAGALRASRPAAAWHLQRRLARLNEAALAADDQLALLDPAGSIPTRLRLMDLELAAARLAALPSDAGEQTAARQAAQFVVHQRRLRRSRWSARDLARAPSAALRSPLAAALADVHARRLGARPGRARLAGPAADSRAAATAGAAGPAGVALCHARHPGFRFGDGGRHGDLAAALVLGRDFHLCRVPQHAVARGYGVPRVPAGERHVAWPGGRVAAGGGLARGGIGGDGAAVRRRVRHVLLLPGVLHRGDCLRHGAARPALCAPGRQHEFPAGVAAGGNRGWGGGGHRGGGVLPAVAHAGPGGSLGVGGGWGPWPRWWGRAGPFWPERQGAASIVALRKVDRQLADLRLALLPLTVGRLALRRVEVERPIPALLECVHWTRLLAIAAAEPDPAAAARAGAIEQRLTGLAAGERPQVPPPPRGAGAGRVVAALDGLDRATAYLSERLTISELHGFSLEG